MAQKEKEAKGKGSGVIVSIVIIAVIVLVILGFSLFSNKNAGQKNDTSDNGGSSLQDETSQSTDIETIGTPEPTEYVIEITNEGFVPKTLKIKKGDKVTWINKIVTKIRPAGNLHPTHTNYPGSSIIKCGTAEEKNIFDACKELQKGESYSFVFNEIGNWGYHDHLQPSKDAKVIVS